MSGLLHQPITGVCVSNRFFLLSVLSLVKEKAEGGNVSGTCVTNAHLKRAGLTGQMGI